MATRGAGTRSTGTGLRQAVFAAAVCCCGGAYAATIVVHNAVSGLTPRYLGANEGQAFSATNVQDIGANLLRIWATMGELEYYDDDWVAAGYPGWPDYPAASYYGQPTPAAVKADPGVIPWNIWADAFGRARWTGATPFTNLLAGCAAAGATPLLVLRSKGPGEDWITWIPSAPDGTNFWNEWWTYCFAVAYWCNVSNDYGVTHFEIHNEPDLSSQGWTGTPSQYVELVTCAHDALTCANDLASLPVHLHAPAVAIYTSSYIAGTLDLADTNVDAVSYHVYAQYASLTDSVRTVRQTIAAHNPDGVAEPLWITEWGDLSNRYDTLSCGIAVAQQLFEMARDGVYGSALFMLYDWGSLRSGLLSSNGAPYDAYYAFRLMARAMAGERDILQAESDDPARMIMATRSSTGVHVVAVAPGGPVTVDLSALGYLYAAADTREYSASLKDAITGATTLRYGRLRFSCPTQAVLCFFLSTNRVDDSDVDGMPDAWELGYFPALTNATAESDSDRDGFPDVHEFLAGTGPTNGVSLLKMIEGQNDSGESFVIRWSSESNRSYTVRASADLAAGPGFGPITNGLPATHPVNAYTDTVGGLERRFYRVELDPP